MKMVKMFLTMLVITAASIGVVYAQNINSSVTIGAISTQITGQITIVDGIGTIILPPKVETETWKVGNITFIRTITSLYWSPNQLMQKTITLKQYKNGLLRSASSIVYNYDTKGILLSPVTRSSRTYTYDSKKRLTSENITNIYYDTTYNVKNIILSSERINITYSYNKNSSISKKTTTTSFYNAKGKFTSSTKVITTYAYNQNGSVKQESTIKTEYNTKGKITSYSKIVKDNTYYDNGDSYTVISTYDIKNKLEGKFAYVSLTKNGESVSYSIIYEVDLNGNITYTHVYDANQKELTSLGGNSYKEPSSIINDLYNSADTYTNIKVEGDLTLNSNRTWDLSKYIINTTGNFSINSNTNGYDFYVNGNMTMESEGTIDLSGYKIYVNGNLSISTPGNIISNSATVINVTGTLNIKNGSLTNNEILPNITIPAGSTITMSSSNVSIISADIAAKKDVEKQVIQNVGKTYPQMADSNCISMELQKK